jgi:hypothetical protein
MVRQRASAAPKRVLGAARRGSPIRTTSSMSLSRHGRRSRRDVSTIFIQGCFALGYVPLTALCSQGRLSMSGKLPIAWSYASGWLTLISSLIHATRRIPWVRMREMRRSIFNTLGYVMGIIPSLKVVEFLGASEETDRLWYTEFSEPDDGYAVAWVWHCSSAGRYCQYASSGDLLVRSDR